MRFLVLAPFLLLSAQAIDAKLLADLRAGGNVLYFRHALTDSAPDADRVNLANCATQRNLSKAGRTLASEIGADLKTLGIPFGNVYAGRYCRNRDTARLIFGRLKVDDDLNSLFGDVDETEAKRQDAALKRLLATPPKSGTNTAIVTHEYNLRRLLGFMLAEGEAAVLRPDGKGSFTLLGRVKSDEWR